MERVKFENAVDAFMQRHPFQPFIVELVSGRRLEVDCPDAPISRAGVAVHLAPGGVPTIFDHRGVVGIMGTQPE